MRLLCNTYTPQKGSSMSRPAIIYRILVASISNMAEEREAIPEVIHSWNTANSYYRGVYLEPVLYETNATPQIGDRPQAIMNEQLVKNCDMLIGIFWIQLGIVGEIEEFREAGKPVLLYFSSAPVVLENIDAGQYRKLLDLKEQYQKEGIVFTYRSISDFREQLQKHITSTMNSIHAGYG